MNKAVNMTPSPLLWNISLAGRAYHFPKTIIFLTFDKLTLGYFQLNMQFQGFAQLHILFLVHWLFWRNGVIDEVWGSQSFTVSYVRLPSTSLQVTQSVFHWWELLCKDRVKMPSLKAALPRTLHTHHIQSHRWTSISFNFSLVCLWLSVCVYSIRYNTTSKRNHKL